MMWQEKGFRRNVVVGLVVPVLLAGCFMNDPVMQENIGDAPPPTGNNTAPEIWGNAPSVVKVSVDYSFTPQAMDADGDPLIFSVNNRPMWLTFDTTSGRISGVPQLGNEGTYNDIEIGVNDGKVSTIMPRFSISVEPLTTPNMPPEIDGTPATSVNVGEIFSFTPAGSDPDGDQLTFSIQNRPGWATFSSSTGQLSGTPQPGDEGTYTNIAITVSDNVSTASLPSFSITVIATNPGETIVDNLDANTTQTGTWQTSSGANPYLGNSVYCETACTFSWQPNLPESGTYQVYAYWTYHASRSSTVPYRIDHDGGTATVVVDQLDSALGGRWNLLGIYNLTAGANGTVTVSTENGMASADAVRYVLVNAGSPDTTPPTRPTGLSAMAIGGSAINLAWTASTDDVVVAGYYVYQNRNYTTPVGTATTSSYAVLGLTLNTSYTFEVRAFDLAGNESGLSNAATATTLGQSNSPPQISGSPTSSVTVGQSYSFTPTVFDPDGGNMTFSIQNRPGWASFSSSTGWLSGTPQTSNIGSYGGIVISVSDGTLSASLPAFSISVTSANSPPQISGSPTSSVNVGQNYSFTPTASDPDDGNLTFSIQNRPGWASFSSSTGWLSGTPQSGDEGSYTNILISVRDDGNLSDTLPGFTITVNQISLGSATLSWTPPTENTDSSALTNLAGFKIYYGTSLGNYPNQITINNPGITMYVVDNLTPNTWYFVSTAINSSGMESDVSNVATKTIN